MRQLAILLLLACTACTTRADAPSSTQAAPPASVVVQSPAPGAGLAASGTLARIHALVGNAACRSDSQCQVLPIGAKACGGPASYLAFSSANTSAADVQALAQRYHAEQQASNQRAGMISNCRVMPTPAAACRANTCQLTDFPATR
jgi:hypothetical protein